jgi:hypothetical protein
LANLTIGDKNLAATAVNKPSSVSIAERRTGDGATLATTGTDAADVDRARKALEQASALPAETRPIADATEARDRLADLKRMIGGDPERALAAQAGIDTDSFNIAMARPTV